MDYDDELAQTETRIFTDFLQLFDHFNEDAPDEVESEKLLEEDIDINQLDTIIAPE